MGAAANAVRGAVPQALLCTNPRSHVVSSRSALEGGNGLLGQVWGPAASAAAQGPSRMGRSRRRGVCSRRGQNPKV